MESLQLQSWNWKNCLLESSDPPDVEIGILYQAIDRDKHLHRGMSCKICKQQLKLHSALWCCTPLSVSAHNRNIHCMHKRSSCILRKLIKKHKKTKALEHLGKVVQASWKWVGLELQASCKACAGVRHVALILTTLEIGNALCIFEVCAG